MLRSNDERAIWSNATKLIDKIRLNMRIFSLSLSFKLERSNSIDKGSELFLKIKCSIRTKATELHKMFALRSNLNIFTLLVVLVLIN